MKRRLVLMRHAESPWRSLASSDHERPLTAQGRCDAPRVAQHLVDLGWAPTALLSSDAQRTRETWEAMAECFMHTPTSHFTRALYHAGIEEIWTESHAIADAVEVLMVLGHNPGWEQAINALCGEHEVMTPASAALLEGEGPDWPSAIRARWRLVRIVRPEAFEA